MRTFSAPLLILLSALQSPKFAVLLDFSALGVHYTNHHADISYGGVTYSKAIVTVLGLSENFTSEVPSARVTLGDLDNTERARFFADSFRGETVTVTMLYDASGTWTAVGVALVMTCDMDEADPTSVLLRLATSDASRGSEVPRRTTQEQGCQHTFMGPLCPFRWRTGMSVALQSCGKTLADCKAHFPVVTESSVTYTVPLPYGGFVGGISHRLAVAR